MYIMSISSLNSILFDKLKSGEDRSFIEFSGKEFSFWEIDRLSDVLAFRLKSLGVTTGDLVGLYMERSEDVLISVLGILKAGAAFLPLDPEYPISRIEYIINDSKVSVMIVSGSLTRKISSYSGKCLVLDNGWHDEVEAQHEYPSEPIDDNELAYVIYTSGSTGNPKGVRITRRSLANLLVSVKDRIGLTDKDVFMAVTTICFDISILELLISLYAGCRLIISENDLSKDSRRLALRLENSAVTIMQATPSLWTMLIEAGWNGKDEFIALCGGEALSMKLADELLERCGSLWNMYGPTETCIWSMMKNISKNDKFISIGEAIDNTYIYVTEDGVLKDKPGDTGELYIGGAGLSAGYYNHDELNEKVFVKNTFDNKCDILYKTGDIVRIHDDHMLEYVQRADFQVKIRGFRVELGDIEKTAEKLDGISKAIAVVNETAGNNIVLFYQGSEKLSKENIAEFLSNNLPEYMVPAIYSRVEEFPMTDNLKTDRRKLSAMAVSHKREDHADDAGNNDKLSLIQLLLSNMWCDILKLDYVGIEENFLDLGGHSLLINRMTNRVNNEFGIELSILDVIKHGMTIVDLEKMIEESLLGQLDDDELKGILSQGS